MVVSGAPVRALADTFPHSTAQLHKHRLPHNYVRDTPHVQPGAAVRLSVCSSSPSVVMQYFTAEESNKFCADSSESPSDEKPFG